jgi:hypothetical protein
MTITAASLARLYDRVAELAEQLEACPNDKELHRQFQVAAARARRFQKMHFGGVQ